MDESQLTEVIEAMHGLAMAQAGQIAALKTVCEALAVTVARSLPPLAGEIARHVDGLSAVIRPGLEPDSIAAFDNALAGLQGYIRGLQQG